MFRAVNTFYEFFAGAGMARAGLGSNWRCLLANDIDQKKARSYRLNWGSSDFLCRDVATLTTADLPGRADLAWASFPCQDLSLAGGGAGLRGERSGSFWPFWGLMTKLSQEGRAPQVIVLENVCGTLTSHDGKDFEAICRSLLDGGYRFGALIVDAVRFVPQSRPAAVHHCGCRTCRCPSCTRCRRVVSGLLGHRDSALRMQEWLTTLEKTGYGGRCRRSKRGLVVWSTSLRKPPRPWSGIRRPRPASCCR